MFNNDNPIYDSAAEIVEMHDQSLLHLPRNACSVNLYNQKLMRVGNLNQASVTCKLWVKTQEWLEVKMWKYTHTASTNISFLILPVGQLNYLGTQTNVFLFCCAWSNFKRLRLEDSKRVEWIHPTQIQTKCHRLQRHFFFFLNFKLCLENFRTLHCSAQPPLALIGEADVHKDEAVSLWHGNKARRRANGREVRVD